MDVLLDVAARPLRRTRVRGRQGVGGRRRRHLHAAELAQEIVILHREEGNVRSEPSFPLECAGADTLGPAYTSRLTAQGPHGRRARSPARSASPISAGISPARDAGH